MDLHMLRTLGSVGRIDVGEANCCYEMMHTVSLSISVPRSLIYLSGNKGGGDTLILTVQ